MESVPLEIKRRHFRLVDPDALRVGACIDFAAYFQTRDYGLAAGQRFAPPGLGYVAKETVLDLILLRGLWWIMTGLSRPRLPTCELEPREN